MTTKIDPCYLPNGTYRGIWQAFWVTINDKKYNVKLGMRGITRCKVVVFDSVGTVTV